jgi:hypothetical protein
LALSCQLAGNLEPSTPRIREVGLGELSSVYKVHPTVIAQWKRKLVDGAAGVFESGAGTKVKTEEELTAPLYEQIGRLNMEAEWLKKKL